MDPLTYFRGVADRSVRPNMLTVPAGWETVLTACIRSTLRKTAPHTMPAAAAIVVENFEAVAAIASPLLRSRLCSSLLKATPQAKPDSVAEQPDTRLHQPGHAAGGRVIRSSRGL